MKCLSCGRREIKRYRNVCDSCYNSTNAKKHGYKWQKAYHARCREALKEVRG